LRIALRSRERRCLALVRFHGLESFDRTERSAYLLPRSRFAVSTAFRSSAPSALQASCDRSRGIVADPPEAPLTGSRTPSGHEAEGHRRLGARVEPAFAGDRAIRRPTTLLGSISLQRFRNRGSVYRGPCLVPATVRPRRFSRPRRLTPPGTFPGLFHPGDAPGIRPSGSCSSRRAVRLSAPCPLLPFLGARARERSRTARLQRFALLGNPYFRTGS
jgi:hypothetical protein